MSLLSGAEVKYFLRTGAWVFGEKLLRRLALLVVIALMARHLGAETFGLLSYAESVAGIIAVLAALGMDIVVVKRLVQVENNKSRILVSAFFLRLFCSFILILAVGVLMSFEPFPELKWITLIISVGVCFQAFNVIDLYYQSQSKMILLSKLNGLVFVFSAALKCLAIWAGAGIKVFALLILLDAMVVAMALLVVLWRCSDIELKVKFERTVALGLLKESYPMLLSGAMIIIYLKIDQIMIQHMLGATQVGVYSVAVRLSEAWYFIPMALTAIIFPKIIAVKSQGDDYKNFVQSAFDGMAIIALLLVVLVYALAPLLIEIIFGEQYIAAVDVLRIHMLALFFVAMGVLRARWLVLESLQVYSMAFIGIGVMVNVVLNWMLIPQLGINGAAYALLCAQVSGTFLAPAIFSKTRVSFFMMVRALLFIDIVKWSLRKARKEDACER